jgi:hypothetical protein
MKKICNTDAVKKRDTELKENEDNENICPPTSQPATIR